ncbi:histidine kinase [Schaalia odontolytica]|uniref:histidine kinase n=1 Tax=Schaalia odontolytica TaxID=1660 RepID=UPI00210E6F99|nr:histidine kinase [Schaalia odontolytica]MCQ5273175.1 histidine kinase [Schaalia odontolytica]MCQ5282073.1 histidine kinase [Schaalia odontolytica]
MSDSNDIPAPSTPSVPAVTDEGTRAAASAGSASVAPPPVRRRSTWTLSMVCGVGGWLFIDGTIVLGVCYTFMAANDDDAALREYGFGYAIGLMLLLLFIINVIGALIGFVDLLRYRTRSEVMQSCLALFLNLLPWMIVVTWVWMA